jgi:hypothetical protein
MLRRTSRICTNREATARARSALLDDLLPAYDYGSKVRVVIHAPPDAIFRGLRSVSLAEMPLAHLLGTLRYLPGLMTGRLKRRPDEATRPFIEVAVSQLLAEDPDRELVVGCVGVLHNLLDQQVVALDGAEAFRAFHRDGYEKLVQSFRIADGDETSGYELVAEHRTQVLGSRGRWKFALYWWLLVGWAGDLLLRMLLGAVKRRAETPTSSG